MLFDTNLNSEEEVLAIYQSCVTQLGQGLTVTSWSSGDSSATLTREISITELMIECKKFLQEVNPDLYGIRVRKATHLF